METLTLQTPEATSLPCEEVEIRGHIIDSLILPKILDCILNNGGTFRIRRMTIGETRHDSSYAVVEVRAKRRTELDRITNSGCGGLCRQLHALGFTTYVTPLSEFVKAGGSAKCLTLRLDGEEAATWRLDEPAVATVSA